MNELTRNTPVKVTLKRSLIGSSKRQRLCIKALGLNRKINNSRVVESTKATQGLMRRVEHLIDVVEAEVKTQLKQHPNTNEHLY